MSHYKPLSKDLQLSCSSRRFSLLRSKKKAIRAFHSFIKRVSLTSFMLFSDQKTRNHREIQPRKKVQKSKRVMYLLPIFFLTLSSFIYFHPVFTTANQLQPHKNSSLEGVGDPSTLNGLQQQENKTTTLKKEAISSSMSSTTETIPMADQSLSSLDVIEDMDVSNEYIPIEDIGEFVNEEDVEMHTKQINPYNSPHETSINWHENVRDFNSYRIRSGDTLWLIATKFKISIDTVVSANNLYSVHRLRSGRLLHIPPYSGLFYRVQSGDSLMSISKAYQIPMDEIQKYNHINDYLVKGTVLFLHNSRYQPKKRVELFGTLFMLPLEGAITSKYGMRTHPIKGIPLFHTGVDIAHRKGAVVRVSASGRVVYSGVRGNYGKIVEVQHKLGYSTVYAHLSVSHVKVGQWVRKGQKIGSVGSTGMSTGPHLHFEIKSAGKYVNPSRFLRFRTKQL